MSESINDLRVLAPPEEQDKRCAVLWTKFNRCVRPVGHTEPHLTDAGFSWRAAVDHPPPPQVERCAIRAGEAKPLDLDVIRRQHALGYGQCHVDELIAEVERLRASSGSPESDWEALATDLFNMVLGDFEWVRASGGRHYVCPLCHAVSEEFHGPGHTDDCPRIELARRFDACRLASRSLETASEPAKLIGACPTCGDLKFEVAASDAPERDTRPLRHWRTCEDCGGLLVYDKAAVDAALASPRASAATEEQAQAFCDCGHMRHWHLGDVYCQVPSCGCERFTAALSSPSPAPTGEK